MGKNMSSGVLIFGESLFSSDWEKIGQKKPGPFDTISTFTGPEVPEIE